MSPYRRAATESRHPSQCQKQDWKPAYHKGECALLKEGKAFEVEERRKLHNNGWWFDHSDIGPPCYVSLYYHRV